MGTRETLVVVYDVREIDGYYEARAAFDNRVIVGIGENVREAVERRNAMLMDVIRAWTRGWCHADA